MTSEHEIATVTVAAEATALRTAGRRVMGGEDNVLAKPGLEDPEA
jgi:hypothetical protein